MKAARSWSVRPTEFVEWGERDRVLAEALIEFEENAYCPGCGQLKSKAWDPASEGSWDFATVHCYACAHTDGHAQDANDKTPGELRFMTLDEKSVKIAKARAKAREKLPRQALVQERPDGLNGLEDDRHNPALDRESA